jgi:hypothetical protein
VLVGGFSRVSKKRLKKGFAGAINMKAGLAHRTSIDDRSGQFRLIEVRDNLEDSRSLARFI